MTKEEMDFWSFVFNGLTAIGTFGAVVISLAVTMWPKKRFKIHNIDVRADKTWGEDGYKDSYLRIDIENFLDFPMQVFEARIELDSKDSSQALILPIANGAIPARARYHVKADLPIAHVKKGTCENAKRVKIIIGTSCGDKDFTLGDRRLLCEVIESEDEYIAIKTNR